MKRRFSEDAIRDRETYRCAHCGRFTGRDDEPFFSLEDMRNDCAPVIPFCSEAHADARELHAALAASLPKLKP